MIRTASTVAALCGAGFLLAGCISPPPPPGTCNPAAAMFVVGAPASPANVDAARVAASAETARTISPGQAVTMEYLATRLNLDVDSYNTILDVRCG